MTATQMPTMVVFDLDDTLYEYEPCNTAGKEALFRFATDELGVMSPAFEQAYTQARVNVKKRLGPTASSHSRLLYCHEAMELIGLRCRCVAVMASKESATAMIRPASGIASPLSFFG